jgi:YesN/AraC family two-component response regulator
MQRVLIVDDEPGFLEGITMALEREGREIVACSTFADARQRLLSDHVDILLTDVRLGAFNGIQLAIIARDRNPAIGVVVFSGFDDPVLRAEASEVGAQYLVKPVTAAQLLDLMATL